MANGQDHDSVCFDLVQHAVVKDRGKRTSDAGQDLGARFRECADPIYRKDEEPNKTVTQAELLFVKVGSSLLGI